jgi:serine/threonine protein kinase
MIEKLLQKMRIGSEASKLPIHDGLNSMAQQNAQLLTLAAKMGQLPLGERPAATQQVVNLSHKIVESMALLAAHPEASHRLIGDGLRCLFKAEPGQHEAVKQLQALLPKATINALRFEIDLGDREHLQAIKDCFVGLAPTPENSAAHQRMLENLKRNALSPQVQNLVGEAEKQRTRRVVTATADTVSRLTLSPKSGSVPVSINSALTTGEGGASARLPPVPPRPYPMPKAPAGLASEIETAPVIAVRASVIPRARTLRAEGTPLALHVGQKFKHEIYAYRDMPFSQNFKFSRLTHEAEGLDLVMTSTLFRGGFGKVRLAVSPSGEVLAVKEMRLERKMGFSKMGDPHTMPQSVKLILSEAQRTQDLRTIIDRTVSASPLGVALQREASFVVVDVIEVPATQKVHVVMTREAGDLFDLMGGLAPVHHPVLARSAAAQCFAELAALHNEAAFAHLDIKLENIFFDSTGQTKLMDFGWAKPLKMQEGALTSSARGIAGTIIAPEMVVGDRERDKTNPRLGSATDVWSLGATIASISGFTANVFPFVNAAPPGSSREQAYLWCQGLMDAYTNWYAACPRDANGWIQIARIKDDSIFSRFFSAAHQTTPELTELILNAAMHPYPDERMSAKELSLQMIRVMPNPKGAQMKALRSSMVQCEEANQNIAALTKQAQEYRAWDKAMTEKGSED